MGFHKKAALAVVASLIVADCMAAVAAVPIESRLDKDGAAGAGVWAAPRVFARPPALSDVGGSTPRFHRSLGRDRWLSRFRATARTVWSSPRQMMLSRAGAGCYALT